MSDSNQLRDSNPVPPDVTAGSSVQPPRKFSRFLKKAKDGVAKKFSRSNMKNLRSHEPEVQDALSVVKQTADPKSALQHAKEAVKGIKPLSKRVQSAVSTTQNAPAGLEDAYTLQDTYLKPLKIFDNVIGTLADVHPYAKIALGALSCASKMVIAQADRDQAVHHLVDKLDQVYNFMIQDETLRQISSMRGIVGQISQQTLEYARFIRDYSETKNFWKRLGKDILTETNNEIQQYSDALDALMQSFRDQVARDVAIHTHRIGELLDLSGIAYAANAGLDTRKECLRGTRTEILSQITDWVNSTGDDVPRVLWLSGPAGKGKSAIAHTVAKWFSDAGGLGSCYCFDRRHEKIFSTIARDLADRDWGVRRALADTVQNASALKTTADISQQWQKLLVEPLQKLSESTAGPVVIVIDALDESGEAKTRCDLLHILSGKLQNSAVPQIMELPKNFRFIVTSRPLRDIQKAFAGAQHIRRISMDDILPEVAERDIYAYVSKKLEGLPHFGSKEFTALAKKADGFFEWARLACESIEAPPAGLFSDQSFNVMVSRDPVEREHLLYDMYEFILTQIMPKDKHTSSKSRQTQLAKFCSVMGQILGTAEPLPLDSLNAMRSHFPDETERYKVEVIVEHMESLLSGTTNSSTPIRPLHASFRDYLTDESHNKEFFVDVPKVQRDLAFASLGAMKKKDELSFNICYLKSSYLPNSEDPGLQERVEKRIPPHLSYACRFWISHVQATDFDSELAKDIKSFFDHERLFFWLEVLCLINALSGAVPALPLIAKWLKGHTGYEDTSPAAIDVQRFIQVFGGMILHSTPHLYVSALPFSPLNSALSGTFSTRFPNSLRVASGRDINCTAVLAVISGHTGQVKSVSFSPDGTRIATGSNDRTVRLWDAATGQPVGKPLLGHTDSVTSVSFSPDGTHIVSASEDNTIRLWDIATRQPIGEPLLGHSSSVYSVAFSPDGSRIVTGSDDQTVRLWDPATGKPVGEPLLGHTDGVYSVSFSLDGTRIATASADTTIRLWDTSTGQPDGEPLQGHTNSNFITSVSLSPDGTRFATGYQDGTVQLLDAVTGHPVGEPLLGHTAYVRTVSFSPDGTRIASGSADKAVRLWDVATRQPVGEPLEGHTDEVHSVSFSPDGTRIVSAGLDDRTVRLWDARTGQSVGEPLQGHTARVWSVSFSPDGTHIATGSADTTVRLRDTGTGQLVGDPFCGHTGGVNSVSFSPDGTCIVSGSDDKTVRLWDAGTGQPVGEPLEGHTDFVISVSFSPDGSCIVSGSFDKTVRLWRAATGQPVGEPLRGHSDLVLSVSFSRDGTRIISRSSDGIRVWYAAIGKSFQYHAEEDCSAFSPHGSCIPHPTTNIPAPHTTNDNLISFSSNPTAHALCDTTELLAGTPHDDHTFALGGDGWVLGPNDRLLSWVPPASRKAFYNPRTVLVIPRGGVELDLSIMAHGTGWQRCHKDS